MSSPPTKPYIYYHHGIIMAMISEYSSVSALFVLILFSCAFVGYSQGGGDTVPCIQKLLPCQPFLKGSSSSAPPGASCCVPLKEIVANEAQCLCDVFNNPEILKGLNVTQQDGLNLVKSCGANADVSVCKTAATPPVSSSTPDAPKSSNSSSSLSSPPPHKNSAAKMSRVGGSFGFITIIYFIVSAF